MRVRARRCGAGTSNVSATPCCSCDFGFAGVGCSELDVRIYVGLGCLALLSALCVGMVLSSVASAVASRMGKPELRERLLA